MKLVLGSDHAALDLRHFLAERLESEGHTVIQVGANSPDSYDYPDAADAAVKVLNFGEADLGILICGTGIGISIRANRHPGVRAALCTTEFMATMAREHNHANILCLGARVLGTEQAAFVVRAFLTATPSDGPRHLARIQKIDGRINGE